RVCTLGAVAPGKGSPASIRSRRRLRVNGLSRASRSARVPSRSETNNLDTAGVWHGAGAPSRVKARRRRQGDGAPAAPGGRRASGARAKARQRLQGGG